MVLHLRWTTSIGAALAVVLALVSSVASAGPTLDRIKSRGVIKVGVGTTPGYFAPDSNGRWQGSSSTLDELWL